MGHINIEKIISTVLGDTTKPVSENELIEFISINSKELLECSGLVFLPSGNGYILDQERYGEKGVRE